MNITTSISNPIALETPTKHNGVSHNRALELALQIKQAAHQARAHELDLCVKQIGCDNKLGHNIAKATRAALEDANVSINWIPNSHDFFGSLLFLNGQWAVAFSSAPSVAPEGMSLNVNELAVQRGDVDELFTVTPSLPNEALHAVFKNCEALPGCQIVPQLNQVNFQPRA